MKSFRHAAFILAVFCVVATGVATYAQTVKKSQPKAAAVSIAITKAPTAPPGENSFGEIRGIARNAPAGSKVVIWSLGDTWYVQPFANAPFTEIGSDGKWSATIHGGYEFAAFVVKPSYQPPATTGSLPNVGGNILATCRAKPGK